MAWLFLDESGHFSNSDYICIAGYASSDEGWEAFIPEWSALLKKHALPAIHMKDIVSSKGSSPAAQWAMDKKLAMLEQFIQLIQKHVKAGFGVGLKAAHYRTVVKKLEHSGLVTNPFHAPVFCLARIIKLAAFHTLLKSSEQAIEVVLDDSEQYSMKFYSYFSKLKQRNAFVKERISSITFADDEKWFPLQAADMLAYAICSQLKKPEHEQWGDSNIFSCLLKKADPAHGLVFHGELWTETEEKTLSEAIIDNLKNVMNKAP
jgi:hypothetical protein